jgi:hypothetical protein
MRSMSKLAGAAAILAAMVMAPASTTNAVPSETAPVHPMALRGHERLNGLPTPAGQAGKPGNARTNGITYHNGPVMLGSINAYIIWYGDWSTAGPRQAIIRNFLGSVGGSNYFNINTTYTNGANVRVSNLVSLSSYEANDPNSQGVTNLSDAQIQAIANRAITSNALPKDTNGVYFVLTAAKVSKSGFGTQYCGWHTHASIGGSDIKYSFVGDPTSWMSACAAQTTGPNADGPGDAMVSVIAHELEETATDPDLNAWYDTQGSENADKCAWTFGTTYGVPGAQANVNLKGHDYLIQRNWVNASGGFCAMSL